MNWGEIKEGDVLLSVPADWPGLVTFGFDCHVFLRFCANHPKPFGFRWSADRSPFCPRCGERFIEDKKHSFEMIKTGYTINQQFRYGTEVR